MRRVAVIAGFAAICGACGGAQHGPASPTSEPVAVTTCASPPLSDAPLPGETGVYRAGEPTLAVGEDLAQVTGSRLAGTSGSDTIAVAIGNRPVVLTVDPASRARFSLQFTPAGSGSGVPQIADGRPAVLLLAGLPPSPPRSARRPRRLPSRFPTRALDALPRGGVLLWVIEEPNGRDSPAFPPCHAASGRSPRTSSRSTRASPDGGRHFAGSEPAPKRQATGSWSGSSAAQTRAPTTETSPTGQPPPSPSPPEIPATLRADGRAPSHDRGSCTTAQWPAPKSRVPPIPRRRRQVGVETNGSPVRSVRRPSSCPASSSRIPSRRSASSSIFGGSESSLPGSGAKPGFDAAQVAVDWRDAHP